MSWRGKFPKQTEKSTETVRLRKISSPGNYVEKLVFYTMEFPDKSKFLIDPRTSKNNYGPFNILPVLSKLFEILFSKQLVEFFERILSKCQCGFILGKAVVRNIAYKWWLKLEKKATNNKNNAF